MAAASKGDGNATRARDNRRGSSHSATHEQTPVGPIATSRMMLSIDVLMTGDVARVAGVASLMRHALLLLSLLVVLQLTPSVVAGDSLGDPYKILGVSKYATVQDIRKAYKHLVKEW